ARACGLSSWPSCAPSWLSMMWPSWVCAFFALPPCTTLCRPPPCAPPPPWRYPSGFAGVSFATALGLVVGWLVCCLRVVVVVVDVVGHTGVRGCGRGCWPWCVLSRWPWPVLVVWASLVFDVVGVVAGRGLGRGEGCCWPLPLSMGLTFPVFDDVVHSLAEN